MSSSSVVPIQRQHSDVTQPRRTLSPSRTLHSLRRHSTAILPFLVLGVAPAPFSPGADTPRIGSMEPAAGLKIQRTMSALLALEKGASDKPAPPQAPRLNPATFSARQFLHQLPLQLLLPFSLPLYAAFYSPSAALTAFAVPNPPSWLVTPVMLLFFFVVQICPALVAAAWGLNVFGPDGESQKETYPTLLLDLIHTMTAYLCTRLALSINHACMDPKEYRRRMSTWVGSKESFEAQLITGWLRISSRFIAKEVERMKLACDPHALGAAFELSPPALLQLRGELDEEARGMVDRALIVDGGPGPGEDGSAGGAALPQRFSLPADALALVLLVNANNKNEGYTTGGIRCLFAVALIGTFSSTALRAHLRHSPFGDNVYENIVVIGHYGANLFIMGAVFTFLFAGAVGNRRHQMALAHLGSLISPADISSTFVQSSVPVLKLRRSAGEVRAFMVARSLLVSFGAPQHARLVAIATAFLAILSGVCIYIISAIYASNNRVLYRIQPPFLLLHSLVLPAVVAAALHFREAARVNFEARRHALGVSAARLHVRMEGAGGAEAGGAVPLPLAEQLGLLEDVARIINLQMDISPPVQILGVDASDAVVKSFVGAFLSIYTISCGLYLSRLYGTTVPIPT